MDGKKNILITGSSSGIGEALARHYLAQGHHVGVCGRDEDRVLAVCNGQDATPLIFDTTDEEATARTISGFDAARPIDLAILNAGTHKPTDAANFDLQAYKFLMSVNYMGTVNCLPPLIDGMSARARGQLALVGSIAGYTGLTAAGGYCASKSATMQLARTIRTELAIRKIDVRLISPGFVKTPLTDKNEFDMPFLISTEDAVKYITKGLAGRKFHIAFPWTLSWSIRLISMLPEWAYFRVSKSMLPEDRVV